MWNQNRTYKDKENVKELNCNHGAFQNNIHIYMYMDIYIYINIYI